MGECQCCCAGGLRVQVASRQPPILSADTDTEDAAMPTGHHLRVAAPNR